MGDLRGKTPRLRTGRTTGLPLTPEEQFVVARIDGRLSVEDLSSLTGLEPERVERIVGKLANDGALELTGPAPGESGEDGDGEKTSLAEFAAALGMDPSAFGAEPAAPPAPKAASKHPVLRPYTPATPFASSPTPEEAEEEGAEGADQGENENENDNEHEHEHERRDAEAAEAVAERNYRQVYEVRWHPLPIDQRIAGARSAQGPDLLALCFDADARVIASVLQNTGVGLDHARLIAFHHRTSTGLEVLARRQDWLRDVLVERRLLRNPMIGAVVLGRIIATKSLFHTYKVAIDREVPDLTRTKCRGYVRQKWQTATSEERADLLVRTEARCLSIMSGCTFDAKTTGILCGRPINSAMFVQSVAKFGASPPGLLAHLMKQPFVRKNAALKKMLLAHPNMPGDVKRSI